MDCPHCSPAVRALTHGSLTRPRDLVLGVDSDRYYCVKQRLGLFGGPADGDGLTKRDRWLVGLDIPMPPPDPRVVPLAVAFQAVAARDADTEAKLRGARWLIDLMADAEEELEL